GSDWESELRAKADVSRGVELFRSRAQINTTKARSGRAPLEPAIDRADFEGDPPLRVHHAKGFNQADRRIVDVCRLRRDAVELDDFEIAPLKRLDRRGANIEA